MTERDARPAKSREIALDALLEILERGGYSHIVLRQALEKYQYLDKPDRAFITRVVEGTLEYRLMVDAVLGFCSSVKVEKMKPVIRTILRMGVYQILRMDRIPDSAVCNEAVNLAARRGFDGLKGFVNGVLRTVCRRKGTFVFEDWSLRYSMPPWLIQMWTKAYGPGATEGMLRAFLDDLPTSVRCIRDSVPKRAIRESLCRQGVHVGENPVMDGFLLISGYDSLEALEAFAKGWIQVQDASSGLVGAAADPKPGDFVIDVCGAPGGKCLDIADRLRGSGHVLVRDLTEKKLRLVEENAARAGFVNIETECWDARDFDPRYEGKADLVVADLPCSGFGVIGKKPDIKYRVSMEMCRELAALQRQILSAAARYVKPGGRLVYSTCTISRLENEGQRDWFLREFPFRPGSMAGLPGCGVEEETLADGYVQLLPGKYPCDGFFVSLFQRET